MYIWLLAPNLLTFDVLFWWLRVRDYIIFHRCSELFWLMMSISYILHVDLLILLMIVFLLIGMFFDGLLASNHLIISLALWNPPSWSALQGSFHPIEGWFILTTLIGLFSWISCPVVFIMLVPIFLWSFKLISNVLFGFWRLWLFDYPFSFTLDFTTPNIMDYNETRVIPSISVSRTYVQYFSSILWGNPKLLAF